MGVRMERCIDRVRKCRQQERMSVSDSFDDSLGRDVAARPRPVLHDEWLAEPTRQPFGY